MKSKFSYKSKRTIIIAAIITVLLAGTATGVYFFTKGNAQAQAAGDNNTTQEQYGEAPEENKNEQQNNTSENEQNKNEQGETTPNQQEEQETERQEQTTNNNQTTQNEQTTTTTTGEVPNQEYVTEREETVKNPWESLEVGWGPTQFASIASTANLTAKKSNLEIHKTVDKESVKIGDTLTYTISVKNNGDKVAKAIIYDNVPEGTVLLNKDNNEDENTKKLTWRVTVEPGETENVEFTVRVKAEKGTIKNSAIVNGKTTEETETGIINITGKKEVNTSEAKVGDTLTYTITLTNSGNATGTVTVTDEIPAGTTLVEKSITNNGVESNGTITWTDVEVKAGDTVEVSFKVTINNDTKTSVRNTAVIDDNKPTEEVETKVANITGTKTVDKTEAKVGDTLTYTITLTNNGNADGTVTVTDEIPTGTRIKDENTTGYNNKATNTMIWSDVEVKAGKSVELTLEVVVEGGVSEITNTAKIDNNEITDKPNTIVKYYYTIEHYTENLDGESYTKVDEDIIKDVLAGTETSYTAKEDYTGFTFDDDKTENKGAKVPANNDLVIRLYYTRNSYEVIYKYVGNVPTGASELPAKATYKYGAKVKVAENATAPGYEFSSWSIKDFTMPASNVEIEGSFTAKIDTKYTVEYYYQINGEYKDTTAIKETRTGTTGETVSVTENDKNQLTYNGKKYVFDQEYPENILSGNIAGDGSLILKLYFKQQFTVRYTDGVENETIFEDKVTSGLNYNDDTPKFGNDPVRIGYEFMKWTPEVEEKVTADATYVAQWQAKKYQYTVNYYYNGKIDPKAGINEEAEYGSEVGYMDKSNGFTFEKVDPSSGKITICEDATKNIINVYYIKEVLSVKKEATNNSVNAGDNIEYTITVRNNGLKGITTTVTDTLPTEIDLSEEGIKIIEDSITSGGKYSEGKIIWDSINIDAGTLDEKGEMLPAELTLTFTAKLKGNTIGKTVTNTVSLPEGAGEEKDITAIAEKTVEEKSIEVVEMTEGKKNTTDSNIVIVMDLSSSMNWSIDNNEQKTAELAKRRLTAAKNATKTFIENFYANGQNANSTVSVVAFNNKAWLLEFKGNKTTATRQNYEDLLEAINKISIGDKPSGYGTYMKKALDKTNEKIFGTNGLATTEQYKNNNNVVIFLSDGKPSEKNRNENIDYSGVNDKATPIKAKGASLYTIGFGPEYATVPNPIKDDSPYGLLKNMSSNGKVYQASDTDTLVKQFTDILAEENQSKTLITGIFEGKKITNGTLKIQMSKELVINEENKLVIKHNDQVIVECSSEANLENYYITYDSATKTLTWNINEYLTSNSNGITELKGNVKFVYYISRNS